MGILMNLLALLSFIFIYSLPLNAQPSVGGVTPIGTQPKRVNEFPLDLIWQTNFGEPSPNTVEISNFNPSFNFGTTTTIITVPETLRGARLFYNTLNSFTAGPQYTTGGTKALKTGDGSTYISKNDRFLAQFDVTGDSRNDLLIAQHLANSIKFSAIDGATKALLWSTPEFSRINFSYSFTAASAGDINGDTKPDFVIGQVALQAGVPSKIYYLSGANGALLAPTTGLDIESPLGLNTTLHFQNLTSVTVGAGKYIILSLFSSPENQFYNMAINPVNNTVVWTKNSAANSGLVTGAINTPSGQLLILIRPNNPAQFSSFRQIFRIDPSTGNAVGTGIGLLSTQSFNRFATEATADYNNDGTEEILAQINSSIPGSSTVVIYNGTNLATMDILPVPAPNSDVATISDLNGDGKPDILIAGLSNNSDSEITIFKTNNLTTTFKLFSKELVNNFRIESVQGTLADIGADGKSDVLIGGKFDPNVSTGIPQIRAYGK